MSESKGDHDHLKIHQELGRRIAGKEARKLKARRQHTSIWFGLGTFGIIGWSVAIPVVIGVLVGAWIDSNLPSQFSWTLMLLLLGVILGSLNAWSWINRERQIIEDEGETDDE